MKKLVLFIFALLPLMLMASNQDHKKWEENAIERDSLHSSMVLSVKYQSDTLYVKVRYYSVCCDNYVSYIDITNEGSLINLIHKNLSREKCLCHAEKIMTHKIYANNITEVTFKINGIRPQYGIISYTNRDLVLNIEPLFKMIP